MSTTAHSIDWHDARRQGIGGTDISAILGLNPWRTPLDVWEEKTGRGEPERSPDALERMHWGTVLEDVVARHYAEQSGCRVQRINSQLIHPEVEVARANIDRAILTPGKRARWTGSRVLGANGILECKTAHALAANSDEWGELGTDQVPQHYWLQVQWYIGLADLPWGDLAVLFGGQKFAVYRIEQDAGLFSDLLAEADRWWREHIIADTPPDPSSEAEARRMWASHTAGKERIVDVTVADAVRELVDIKRQIKELEGAEQRLKDLILPEFEDAESIVCQGRKLASWKTNKPSSRTDWKGVANAAGATPEQIAQHTITKPGARTLRLTKEATQ